MIMNTHEYEIWGCDYAQTLTQFFSVVNFEPNRSQEVLQVRIIFD